MQKVFFSFFLMGSVIFSQMSNLYALDTTEPYSRGFLTEFEIYSSLGYGVESKAGSTNFIVGGGILDSLSYCFTGEVGYSDSGFEISSVGIGFIYNAITMKQFALDFMPVFNFSGNKIDGKVSYPNGKLISYGLDLEFNLTLLKFFQPYLLVGFSGSNDFETNSFSWEVPIVLGTMFPLQKGVDFFFQLGWTISNEAIWNNAERTIALGLNVKATDRLEFTTEIGYNFTDKETSVSLGLIYAL